MTGTATVKRAPGRRRVLLALALLSVWGPGAAGQLADAGRLARLGHRDYAVRHRTWCRLLADPDLSSEQIDRLYAGATTSEQRHRLLDVACHHLLRQIGREAFPAGSEACLGVGIMPIGRRQVSGIDQPASYVTKTYPGFPAFACLMPGDIILAVDGQRPAGKGSRLAETFLIGAIRAHRPGAAATLTVRRDGETFDVTVKLASRAALEGLYVAATRALRRMPLRAVVDPRNTIAPQQVSGLPLRRRYRQRWHQRYRQLTGLTAETPVPDARE